MDLVDSVSETGMTVTRLPAAVVAAVIVSRAVLLARGVKASVIAPLKRGRQNLNHCAALPGLRQTNSRAELQACIHALRLPPLHVPLQLCADLQPVTDGTTEWVGSTGRVGSV